MKKVDNDSAYENTAKGFIFIIIFYINLLIWLMLRGQQHWIKLDYFPVCHQKYPRTYTVSVQHVKHLTS